MVLKVSKGGVYSGNTLRASNSRYHRRYRTHSFILRILEGHMGRKSRKSHASRMVDEFQLSASDVEFSLNKRKRWGLPTAILKYIQNENDEEIELKTDLLIKHKLKRQSNCVAFYSNKGNLKRLVPRAGRYFDGKSVTKLRTEPSEETPGDENEVPYIPELAVRYEVYIPCSSSSSIVHNPKYIQHGACDIYKVKKDTHKKRSRIVSRCNDEMLEFCDPLQDDAVDSDSLCEEDTCVMENSHGFFFLKDFFKPERKRKRNKSRRKLYRYIDESDNAPRVVYSTVPRELYLDCVEGESVDTKGSASIPTREPTAVLFVPVKISKEETGIENLQTMFESFYTEAKCQPRRFTIDITDRVTVLAKGKMLGGMPSSYLDLQCFLVFCEEGPCAIDARFNIYNVGLNLSSHAKSMKLETVVAMDSYSISELEENTLIYISTLPRAFFVERKILNMYSEPIMNFELVNKSQKWNIKCIHPVELWNQFPITTFSGEISEREPSSDTCNICYDVIRTDSSMYTLVKPATYLDACGHWFCNDCWGDHLAHKFTSGTCRSFTCPEHGCNVQIDLHTLLSMMHISDIRTHMQRVESEKFNISEHARWCPTPNCGRVILIDAVHDKSRAPPSVVCSCGVDLCFCCLQNAHWPASCRQAKWFREKVLALKDYVDLPKDFFLISSPDAVVAEGKSCPKCKRFIEKVSGCLYMSCPCGCSFCWTCADIFHPLVLHNCIPKDQRRIIFEEYETQPNGMQRTPYYVTAVTHRQHRLYKDNHTLTFRAHSLVKRLCHLAENNKKIQKQVNGLPNEDGQPVRKTIRAFIMRILGIKLELHHVIENTSVAMDCMDSRATRRKLLTNVRHLESCANAIEMNLNLHALENNVGIETMLFRLHELRVTAERSVNNIARLMDKQ